MFSSSGLLGPRLQTLPLPGRTGVTGDGRTTEGSPRPVPRRTGDGSTLPSFGRPPWPPGPTSRPVVGGFVSGTTSRTPHPTPDLRDRGTIPVISKTQKDSETQIDPGRMGFPSQPSFSRGVDWEPRPGELPPTVDVGSGRVVGPLSLLTFGVRRRSRTPSHRPQVTHGSYPDSPMS